MYIYKIAYERLAYLASKLRKKFPFIVGLKLSGSIADNNFFLLQFSSNKFIASDYDVVVLVNNYPTEKQIREICEILRENVSSSSFEDLLIKSMDVKIFTLKFPYEGKGVKIPSVYDKSISVKRHLCGGKIIFGNGFFEEHRIRDERTLRELVFRILDRKKIFDCFTDLGAMIRIAKLMNWTDLEKDILKIVERYENYHVLSEKDINEFMKDVKKISEEIMNRLKYG